MILAGDIGGTHTRLGIFNPAATPLAPLRAYVYASRDFPGLAEIALDFLAQGKEKINLCCLGVAGPVVDGKASPTNLPWNVDAAQISNALGARTLLINDLEANAYGIGALGPDDFAILQKGTPGRAANAAVISAGTGLGQAGLYWDGRKHIPFASEGGHATFSPRNASEIHLLEYLLKRFEHVSWERVLSGPGLLNIYEFLRDTGRGEEPDWLKDKMRQTGDPSAVISQAAIHGKSDLCKKALHLFVGLYGSEAGNLALKTMSLAGVYLGGGIAPRILGQMKDGSFRLAFNAKGRMQPTMETIPVFVIVNDRAGLVGAARFGVIHV
jgi:glucokinase